MLSLVAHAIGYKMIIGAHNTVNVRRMWEVTSSSSGMVDVGARHTIDAERHAVGFTMFAQYGKRWRHNTVDASEACGGALPCLSGMGVDGAHNTVG